MSRKLREYVAAESSSIGDDLATALKSLAVPHYAVADEKLLRTRTRKLVDAFVSALETGPRPFVEYVQQMTEERIAEGYYLVEIQTALSLLEERVWRIVVAEAPIAELVSHLGAVTTIVGNAKDELARVYLTHKERADETIAGLESQLRERPAKTTA
jgi:hypothetical protein